MLKNIFIKNIVLIEKLDVNLSQGLVIFSGETGAGKSIILTSLSLAMGKRADQALIRQGKNEGSVAVEFEITNNNPVLSKLQEDSLVNSNQILIRRTINKDGKSKAFINDNPVTVGYLQDIGSQLLEIHGQNEKIGLLDTSSHLKIMDKFGNYSLIKDKTKNAYDAFIKLKNIYEEALNIDKNKINHVEELKNKINLINTLSIKENEENDLVKKRNLMTQYDKIFSCINDIYLILSEDNNNLVSKLSSNAAKLENIAANSDTVEEINVIVSSLNNVLIETKEIISGIDNIKENYSFDEKELEFTEQRLFDINNLTKKLDIKSSELPKLSEKLSTELNNIDKNLHNIEKIKEKLDHTKILYEKFCKELSLARSESAIILENAVNKELKPLKLIDAKFRVEITEKSEEKFNALGSDNIKFVVKLNKGAKEGEIHKISSGGELSRLMLALNLVLSGSLNKKTIIFDEVDSGISGAVADSVGTRLQSLAKSQQVLVVTHLPQVAARGKQHFKSFKYSEDNNTFTGIEELNYDNRVEEIAKMMSGEIVTEEAKLMANKLMENN